MSLGDMRSNGNGQVKKFDSTYYSRLHFDDGKNNRINISYMSGLMKITYATNVNGNPGASNYEDMLSIYLTGVKATSLIKSMNDFEAAIADGSINNAMGFGVSTGMKEVQTLIIFHLNGTDGGKAFTIAQIDQSGNYTKKFTYEFPKEYDFRIKWNNINTMDTKKEFDPELQYEMLKNAIAEFSRTYNGAAGYNAIDLGRYDYYGLKNLVSAIADKCGIQRPQNQGFTRQQTGGGFFNSNNNNNGGGFQQQPQRRTLDDIQQSFMNDDDEE